MALEHGTTALTDEQVDATLQRFADGFVSPRRTPILHSPSEHGLDYENVTFSSGDGVPLAGWFIPAAGSDKLIIASHPSGFNRAGMPTHLEPWKSDWAPSGNAVEVDFTVDYRILHDAGYNVLAFDLRNHGLSGAANGGITSSGIFEARDIAGALSYARDRGDTRDMTIGLFSRCMGCNATFSAMTQFPEAFDGVRCLVAPQPLTPRTMIERRLAAMGLFQYIDEVDRRLVLRTGIGFAERSPGAWARNVRLPTFLYQVRDDALTLPSDVQTMYDNIPVEAKKLLWIEGTTARWDGYLEFQRRPEPMLKWFETYVA